MKPETKGALGDLMNYVPSAVLPPLFGFLSISVFTRIFSPQEYGIYILVNTTVLFLQMVFFSWLNQSALRYYEKFRSMSHSFFSTGFLSFIALMLIIPSMWYLLLFICRQFYMDTEPPAFLLWIPLLLLAQAGSRYMLSLTRARRESVRYSTHMSVMSLLKFIIPVLLFYTLGTGLSGIFIGIFAAGILVLVHEGARFAKIFSLKIKNYSGDFLRIFITYGIPLIGLSVASYVLSSSDRYMIGFFMGADAVGIYSAGYQLAETSVSVFSSFLMTAFFPVIVQTFEKSGRESTQHLVSDLMGYYLMLALPVVFGVTLLCKEMTSILLGKSFFAAYQVLPVVSAGVFFLGLSMYFNKSFELKEKTSHILSITMSASILNIALNLILIPMIGILGAALSTLISYMLSFGFSVWMGNRMIQWRFPWKLCLRVIFYCVIMCLFITVLPLTDTSGFSLTLKISAGGLAYLALVAVFEKKRFLTFVLSGKAR